MAKKKPSKPKAPSLLELAAKQARRSPIDSERYSQMRVELEKFVMARASGDHSCGLSWFVATGMPTLNKLRLEQGLPEIPFMSSAGPIRTYALKHWPDEAKHFCR